MRSTCDGPYSNLLGETGRAIVPSQQAAARGRDGSFAKAGKSSQVSGSPRLSVNTAEGVIGGAMAGLGIARVMSYLRLASAKGPWHPSCRTGRRP